MRARGIRPDEEERKDEDGVKGEREKVNRRRGMKVEDGSEEGR